MTLGPAVQGDKIDLAELYEVTYSDGTVKYFTAWNQNITWSVDSNLYLSAPITREGGMDKTADLSTGEIVLNVPRDNTYMNVEKLLNRYLDNAEVKITWIQRSVDTRKRISFLGKVGEVNYNKTMVLINLKNELNEFKKKIPKRKYQEGCDLLMYGEHCRLVKADFEVTGTADAGSTDVLLKDATRTEADDYFVYGYMEMTSGLNITEKRMVIASEPGTIEVLVPFSNVISIGDSYKMYPHCQKTFDSCKNDFANQLNYGGAQDVPRADEILL